MVNTPAWATKREGNRLQFHRCTKKRNSGLETKRWEAQWILSWGKSAQSSPDFTVPVYIGWEPCQHSNYMKFCSWLAPFNSVAYVKQNLTCSLTAGDGYFILQILSTLFGTTWPTWKNRKNLKTTSTSDILILKGFVSFFFFFFFNLCSLYGGTHKLFFCHFWARVFTIYVQKQQPSHLNVPLQVILPLTQKPGALQRMVPYS